MPIKREKLTFTEDLDFLEKMEDDLFYSTPEMAELILDEKIPTSLEEIIEYLRVDWESAYKKGKTHEAALQYAMGEQAGTLFGFSVTIANLMGLLQSLRTQEILTVGYGEKMTMYWGKTFKGKFK